MFGGIACFVDFLTVPIISLGLPLIIYFLCLQKQKKVNLKETIIIIIKASLAWGISYGLIWFSKWAIVDLLYGRNLIKTSLLQVKYRATGLPISYGDALFMNYNVVKSNSLKCIFFGVFGMILNLIIRRKNRIHVSESLVNIVPYLIILLMPFVWYFVLKDHSFYHSYFTYRTLTVAFVAVPLMLLKLTEKKKLEK